VAIVLRCQRERFAALPPYVKEKGASTLPAASIDPTPAAPQTSANAIHGIAFMGTTK
jgi:hypothetical protein